MSIHDEECPCWHCAGRKRALKLVAKWRKSAKCNRDWLEEHQHDEAEASEAEELAIAYDACAEELEAALATEQASVASADQIIEAMNINLHARFADREPHSGAWTEQLKIIRAECDALKGTFRLAPGDQARRGGQAPGVGLVYDGELRPAPIHPDSVPSQPEVTEELVRKAVEVSRYNTGEKGCGYDALARALNALLGASGVTEDKRDAGKVR